MLMDPVVAAARRQPGTGPGGGPAGVYLFGNLCLEADLITRRTVYLPRRPRPGDLLAFANTAGYFMDFRATARPAPARRPQGRGLAGRRGAWRWCLDEQYWPVTGRAGAA